MSTGGREAAAAAAAAAHAAAAAAAAAVRLCRDTKEHPVDTAGNRVACYDRERRGRRSHKNRAGCTAVVVCIPTVLTESVVVGFLFREFFFIIII